jgi:5-formyltetrahydrofolate cyclo-ligase
MEDVRQKKMEIRNRIHDIRNEMPEEIRKEKTKKIIDNLFDFANFLEARIPLLYVNCSDEIETGSAVERIYNYNKIVIFPVFHPEKRTMKFFKVDNFHKEMKPGPRGNLEPDIEKCKKVPIESLDIAIIPGIAFDEKGGRMGTGMGYYDRLIPKLPITTRKVSLAMEEQLYSQVPTEPHDKNVDIIITDERVIYKI